MALNKQTKKFIFSQGVDTKTTPELLPIGKLQSAENVRFNQSGKLSKKKGTTAFTTSKIVGSALAGVRSIFEHLGGLYAVATQPPADRTDIYSNSSQDSIFGYSPSQNKWSFICRSGNVEASSSVIPYDLATSTATIIGLIESASTIDAMYINGYLVSVQASTGFSRVNITDPATGEVILAHDLTSSLSQLRVIAFGTRAIVIGVSGTSLLGYNYDTTALPSSVPTAITFTTALTAGTILYDCFVASFNSNLYIAFANNAAGISLQQYSSIVTSGVATTANTGTIAEVPTLALCIFGGESTYQKIYVGFSRAALTRVNITSMTFTGATLGTLLAVEAKAIVGAFAVSNGGYVNIIVEATITSGGGTYAYIRCYRLDTTIVGSCSGEFYNISLASKILVYNSTPFLVVVNTDRLERTYFLVGADQATNGNIANIPPYAKLLFGRAGFAQSSGKSNLPSLVIGSGYAYCTGYKFVVNTASLDVFCPVLMKFRFDAIDTAYQYQQIAGLTYLTGGVPGCFDGKTFFESSYIVSPRIADTGVGAIGAGALTLGTYQVCYVFEYVDGQGNRHQSAPSIPLSITLTGAQNTLSYQWFPVILSWHLVQGVTHYRTQVNGAVFYKTGSSSGSIGLTPQSRTEVFSDATIGVNEILYTAGNVIENQSPTATKGMTIWKSRLWCLTDDGIVYSKVVTDGFPLAFNPVFNINTLVNAGVPTAVAANRDKLFAFYADNIFYTTGEGPSDTGEGAFSQLEEASSGVGCLSAASVAEMQDQLIFLSRDGWRSINSSLTVSYIGAEIQQYMSENTTIYSAQYFDSLHEARIMDGNRTYVYDTYEKQWTIIKAWTDYRGILWSGIGSGNKKYVRLRSDAAILYEDSSTYLDAGTFTPLLVRTGWINMDQFVDFERLYKILILGRYYTPNTMKISVFYDYVPQVVETFSFSSSNGNFAAFTDANIYDNDSYAGNGYPFEVEFRPSQQKCQAIRIQITDEFVSGNGQAFDLIGMNLVLGIRNVDAKIRDAAKATGTGRPAFVP